MNTFHHLFDTDYGSVWRFFDRICNIPRPSGKEYLIRQYLKKIALQHQWEVREDSVGNMAFSLPGKGKKKNNPILVLQAHVDMVCEKNDGVDHNFEIDSICPLRDGEWIRSRGTTLGADNGIGVALMLALGEISCDHRIPIELLFTVDEETGMTGAMNLEKNIVKGRKILNLDSEDDKVIIIGCAGGIDMVYSLPFYPLKEQVKTSFIIKVTGLRGGHSGINIQENRGNALLTCAYFFRSLYTINKNTRLLHFEGGNKKNAIPREATCTVVNCEENELHCVSEKQLEALLLNEPDANISFKKISTSSQYHIPFDFIDFIASMPNGVSSMDMPNVVRTSSSLGIIKEKSDHIQAHIHARSLQQSELDNIVQTFENGATDPGKITIGSSYPPWSPSPNSPMVAKATSVYQRVLGRYPEIASIHAGLETGVIGSILGANELFSIGPTIKDAHSPNERVNIKSTEKIFIFLQEFIAEC